MGSGRTGGTRRRATPVTTRVAGQDAGAVVLAELARHLVAASHASHTTPEQTADRAPNRAGAQLARHNPAQEARARASWARTLRIQAGHSARRLPYLATGVTYAAGWGAWSVTELAAAAAGPAG